MSAPGVGDSDGVNATDVGVGDGTSALGVGDSDGVNAPGVGVGDGTSAPGVGAGAVLVDHERVLLVRRGKAPAAGKWSFPGGRVELGESLADGVRREVTEECGLSIDVGPILDVVEVVRRESGTTHHWVVVDYLASWRGGQLVAGDDAAEAGWFTLDEIADLPTTPGVPEVAARAIAARRVWDPGGADGGRLPPSVPRG